MRTPLISGFVLLAISACSGDDLVLPDGAPAQIRAVSGDGQTAQVGDPLRHPLVVEVLDRAGRPLPGTAVAFEFVDPAQGAEISAPAAETDASGRASAQVTLGNTAGDQPVIASLAEPGTALHVEFLLTALQRNNPGGDGNGGGGSGGGDDGGGGSVGGDDGGGGGAGPAPASPSPDDGHKGKDKNDHNGKGKGGKGKDKHGD
jgi:uncharacterized membrane protein YgcG